MDKLEQYVNDNGKEATDDTVNEVKKIQYRIKDFLQVYNISEKSKGSKAFLKTQITSQWPRAWGAMVASATFAGHMGFSVQGQCFGFIN